MDSDEGAGIRAQAWLTLASRDVGFEGLGAKPQMQGGRFVSSPVTTRQRPQSDFFSKVCCVGLVDRWVGRCVVLSLTNARRSLCLVQ